MKLEIKELQKALDYLKKSGNPTQVTIDLDARNHFRMSAYTDSFGQINITIFDVEIQKFPEVTKTERL